MFNAIKTFFRLDSAASLVLVAMLVLAMLAANSPFSSYYDTMHTATMITAIDDGLMTFFFLCIGIEIKQEIIGGSLASPRQVLLPVVAAVGGVITPALIYYIANKNSDAMHGWAIPTATDIAFSLGVLNLFGKQVPPALRIFLMSVAIFDDVIAIAIIGIFYTRDIQLYALFFALGCLILLGIYNRYVQRIVPFIFAGAALWVALFDSGVNPTVAGVALGLLMPGDMGKRALRFLHGPVAFVIVPLFVFSSSGVPLESLYLSHIVNPVSLGVASGLFLGKQTGIFAASLLVIRTGLAKLPQGVSWWQLYAVSIISGIGFTMSLFIGSLAFNSGPSMLLAKTGVIAGSLASAAVGILCMMLSTRYKKSKT